MTRRQLKTGYLGVQWLNSVGTAFYGYYLFFFMQREFGFGNLENLLLSATQGFVYMFASLYGGRFGQRHGYVRALLLGFGIMILALSCAWGSGSVESQIGWMIVWTIGICFTWPALEALITEGEDPLGLQRMVGIYNLTWASASALTYFVGGAIAEKFGLRSIFWLPVAVHAGQLGLLGWLATRPLTPPDIKTNISATALGSQVHQGLNPRPIARAKMFLRLAWMANPFAYVAINTLAAVIPGLAAELNLTPMFAGFFCSIWFFARWFTFLALWLWPGWHYRPGWFFGAFVLLIGSFAAILLLPSLAMIMVAQVSFGVAVGLIYYSSLFYSMDAGDAKGEHGGVHEAAIGLGIFAGPAVGATALKLLPDSPRSGIVAVTGLLCVGLVLLIGVWRKSRR